MAIKLADTARPNNYVDAEHLGTYPVAYAEDVWFADGTRLSEKTFDGDSIQKAELPVAGSTESGKIYQYIGEDGTYKHGYFYECVEDDGIYSWEEKTVSTDYPIKEVDTLPTGDNIENYIYSKRDSEYSLDIAGFSVTEIENALITNGFTVSDTPLTHNFEFLVTYPTPIDVWNPSMNKWFTPEEYNYIALEKTNPPEIGIVRTHAYGQRVTLYISAYGEYTVFKYSDPTNYYIGDSARESTERLALHSDLPTNVDNLVEYCSTSPAYHGESAGYENGSVIVYSGDDSKGFLKGHHYKYATNFTTTVKVFRIYINEEHSSYHRWFIDVNNEPKVGTHLYNENNNEFWFQGGIIDIGSDYITIYEDSLHQTQTFLYGWEIEEDTRVANVVYDWVDIGGGGDGGNGYEEFVGTQAEWDALSQSQKDKYDGKIVNITDDEDSSTSDIAQISNPFTVNTSKSAGSLEGKACKQGRIVQFKVYIESFKNIVEGEWNTLGTVAQTIKPFMETPVSLSAGVAATATAYARITTNGELQIWGSSDLNTLSSRFFATYFSAN